MRKVDSLLWLVAFALIAEPALADREIDLSRFFPGYKGALVVLDVSKGEITRGNPAMCRERRSPCSTFKIPNSLIGLETGVIKGADFVIPWDGVMREREVWNRDHDLRSAIRNSVVWYYQELARRVGAERMGSFVRAMHYGNEDTSGEIDHFWLGSSLQISPDEQVRFLRSLHEGALPFSARSMAIVKEILIQPWPAEGVVYRGKAGSCSDAGEAHGWWVGSVEKEGHLFIFAALIEGEGATGMVAQPMVEQALVEMGILPLRRAD